MAKIGLKKRKTLLLLGISIATVLIASLVVYILFLRGSNETDISSDDSQEFQIGDIVTESVKVPDENYPKDFYVPPDLPKVITIPSISIRGYIQLVGVDQDGLIAVPTNVHIAGWYINSVKPGESGLCIMDGHRDGTTMGGIFRDLEDVKQGEKMTIEYGDGTVYEFEFVDLNRLSTEDAYDFMYSRIDGVDVQLNLVTCGGKWNSETETYEDRIIVRAKGI